MTLEHWIEFPSEPKELLLVWQAPSSISDRLRWAVGRLRKVGDEAVFCYLRGEEFAGLNAGRSPDELEAAGFSGYPAFDRNAKRRPEGDAWERALGAFLRRLPPATRSDFSGYLAHFLIKAQPQLSQFALLAATGARLPSDGFSLVDPLDPSAQCVDFIFEIAGLRHYERDGVRLEIGSPLKLEPEPSNLKDPNAVQVKASGKVVGYVNRLQANTIRIWLIERKVECWVVRRNDSGASPRAYAFLRVRSAESAIAA